MKEGTEVNNSRKRLKLIIVSVLLFATVLFSIFAPALAPNDPLDTDFSRTLEGSSEKYPLGTDQVGRCIYSRLLYGTKATLGTAFLLLGAIAFLGVVIGTFAGFRGGFIDSIIMKVGDIVLAFPETIFAIIIVGMLGPSMRNTIIALSMVWWVKYARISRVLVKKEKNSEYIQAAKIAGATKFKIIRAYVLPNILPQIIVQISVDVGSVIIALAGFSFLGLGMQPPSPEWGNMLNEGRAHIQTTPRLLILPGLCIFIMVFLFNTLGDLLRSILNPKES